MGMYLRDMGRTALLTREGEVTLAKRIEGGRRTMLCALHESMPAMRAITALRDMIDVDAAYDDGRSGIAGPDYAALEPAAAGEGGRPSLPVMEEAILPGVMDTVQ